MSSTPKNIVEFFERFRATVLEEGLEPALFQYFHPDEEIYEVIFEAATIKIPIERLLDYMVVESMIRQLIKTIDRSLDEIDNEA